MWCEYIVAPEIVVRLTNLTVIQGQNIRLTCQFYALPPPQITWLKGHIVQMYCATQ